MVQRRLKPHPKLNRRVQKISKQPNHLKKIHFRKPCPLSTETSFTKRLNKLHTFRHCI